MLVAIQANKLAQVPKGTKRMVRMVLALAFLGGATNATHGL